MKKYVPPTVPLPFQRCALDGFRLERAKEQDQRQQLLARHIGFQLIERGIGDFVELEQVAEGLAFGGHRAD